jgi:hypothetical protein
MTQIRFTLGALLLALLLLGAMLLFLELGRRLRARSMAKSGVKSLVPLGAVTSLVYAVLSLLLSFMFAGAAARFDGRRALISDELNAISTAWIRIDPLPQDRRDDVRDRFRAYVDALIALYVHPGDLRSPEAARQHAAVAAAANELWTRAVAACLDPGGEAARMLLLPALNEMFDAVDQERVARRMHPAPIVWIMLAVAALAASLFAGYDMAGERRNWIYMVGIAATISIVTFVIIDLEYPRLGIVRVDDFDQLIVQLRAGLRS